MRKITGLNIKPIKKHNAVSKQEIMLIKDFGPEGDAYGGPGERQITLLGEKDLAILEKDRELGLCIDRFVPNIILSGSTEDLVKGKEYSMGDIQIKVSGEYKKCHKGCPLLEKEKRICHLPASSRFASILKSGTVRIDDIISEL